MWLFSVYPSAAKGSLTNPLQIVVIAQAEAFSFSCVLDRLIPFCLPEATFSTPMIVSSNSL
jgi:hypothetical protein